MVKNPEAQEKTRKPTATEPQKTLSISTPTGELAQGPTSPEQPEVIEKKDKVDGFEHDASEPHNTASSPTTARESSVQNPVTLEKLEIMEKGDKADELSGSNGPEMTSPIPPSEPEPRKGPTMLGQPEALEIEEVAREPVKAEATGPATNQGSVDEGNNTIIYREPAPNSPSPLCDDKKTTGSPPRENEAHSPTKRKASGQGRKQPAPKNARRSAPGPPRKTAKQRKWDPPFVITDPKSPLTEADLRVCIPAARAPKPRY
jgi:hypothetical protein